MLNIACMLEFSVFVFFFAGVPILEIGKIMGLAIYFY